MIDAVLLLDQSFICYYSFFLFICFVTQVRQFTGRNAGAPAAAADAGAAADDRGGAAGDRQRVPAAGDVQGGGSRAGGVARCVRLKVLNLPL